MQKLYDLLTNCCPAIDFEKEDRLVSDKKIDSMDLIAIISDIEDEYDISVPMDQIDPCNFDSADAIWKLIEKLK